jgi:hypothetical protein
MDIGEQVFEATKHALNRGFWFVLATVLTSSLILAEGYIEQFSQHDALLKGALKEKVKVRDALLKCLKLRVTSGTADAMCSKLDYGKYHKYKDLTGEALLDAYVDLKYVDDRTQNTLEERKFSERPLPFLLMNVPDADYLPIMAVMLAIFGGGVWLSSKSILGCLEALLRLKQPRLLDIARLYFIFPVPHSGDEKKIMGNIVRYVALWFPAVALLGTILLDFRHPIERLLTEKLFGGHLGPGSFVFWRLVFLLAIWIVVFSSCQASSSNARHINRLMKSKAETT